MKPSFRYPGGKSKLAKVIVPQLEKMAFGHNCTEYREPFFGGGGIGLDLLFGWMPTKGAWLNDLDVGIACLWLTVFSFPKELKELILQYHPKVADFDKIKKELQGLSQVPSDKAAQIDIGFKKLVIQQISYCGLGTQAGGPQGGQKQNICTVNHRWSPKSICKRIDWANFVLSRQDIPYGVFSCSDFSHLLAPSDQKILVYLDPPYYEHGDEMYPIEFSEADHLRMAGLLRETKHTWLLSYDDCKEVRELYTWAKIESLPVKYTISGVTSKREVLISSHA